MPSKQKLRSLRFRLQVLRAELATCTTDAMRASVQGVIDVTARAMVAK